MGVVLAGGRSSRMKENKALMLFKEKPLLEHMISILKNVGIKNIKISGEVEGYDCEADEHLYEGPAKAIESIIQKFLDVEGFLFIPVDMPFLSVDVLRTLIKKEGSAYYQDWPLPVLIRPKWPLQKADSVHNFIRQQKAEVILIPKGYEDSFVNLNTPEEWKQAVK